MTNADLLAELGDALNARDLAEKIMIEANNNGTLTDDIELAYLEAEEDVKGLQNELAYRANWEQPRRRVWL